MIGTSLILGAPALKKQIELVVADLYNLAKAETGKRLSRWKNTNYVETVYKRIRQLRLVKTISQSEKEIDLQKFYYLSKVLLGERRRVVIHLLKDLQHDGSIVVEGTAGQGKSTFLRYLANVEFCTSRRIPVFVELRRIRSGQSLLAAILVELKSLGFDMDEDVFRCFADRGRLLILLDAFDEVKDEARQDLLSEIEALLRQHEAMRVVITSRPDSGVSSSPLLRVFRLCSLEGEEHQAVIRKMAHDDDTAEAIIKGIGASSSVDIPSATPPLMIALLMVRYKIDQSLPQNRVSFYDALFFLLLQRHDKMKGGYIRPRKSRSGDLFLQETGTSFGISIGRNGHTPTNTFWSYLSRHRCRQC